MTRMDAVRRRLIPLLVLFAGSFLPALVPLLADSHVPESFPIHALTVPGRHRAPRVKAVVDFVAAQFDHPA